MKFPGFIGAAYKLRSVNVENQQCINLYPEMIESQTGKEAEVAYLAPTPGLTKIMTLGNGPIRCVHTDSIGRIFVVTGNQLYKIGKDTLSALVANNYAAITVVQSAAVTTATDTVTATAHGFYSGLKVHVSSSSGLPAGLSALTDYFLIVINANNFQLATTLANSVAGTQVDITTQGTGNMTITPQIAPTITKTFAQAGNVSLSTDLVLPGGSSTSPSGFSTGQKVRVTSDILPSGLTAGTTYYVIKVDANTIELASSVSNASGGTQIDITNANTGTMTVTPTPNFTYLAPSTAIDASADTIALTISQDQAALPYLFTGLKLQVSTSGSLPGGLSAATDYWVISDGSPFISLASTLANAAAGTKINITSQGSGTHTLTTTTVANTTTDQATNVNASNDHVTITGHGYYSGLQVTVSGGSLPTGLATGIDYYTYSPDSFSVGFSTTANNSIAGVLIDLTVAGSQNMTITAQQSSPLTGIVQANINASTDTITYASHGLYTGLQVQFTELCTTSGGLDFLVNYYIIKTDANSFQLATSIANASTATALDITAYSGSWNKSLVGSNGLDGGGAQTFTGSSGIVKAASMSYLGNGTESSTLFVDGTKSYWFQDNGASTSFGALTGFGFTDISNPETIVWVDGFFIVNQGGTNEFWVSDVNSPNFSGLSFASAEGYPDIIMSLAVNNRYVWIFNQKTTEIYIDTGNADFPFERIQGGFLEYGIAAQFSLAKVNSTLFWLGRTENGQGIVYMANGTSPQRVSTHAIETAINGYSDISTATGYAYQSGGHDFYVLNFSEATWCFDMTTHAWHQRSYTNSGAQERHRGDVLAFSQELSLHLLGDYSNGKVYNFDDAVYTDDSGTITRLRSSPHLSSDLKRVRCSKFQLDMETGVGLDGGVQGSAPTVILDFSDDGGHTYSSETWALADGQAGSIGEYKDRVIWRRLGIFRDRIFRVKITDPVKVILLGAHLELTAEES